MGHGQKRFFPVLREHKKGLCSHPKVLHEHQNVLHGQVNIFVCPCPFRDSHRRYKGSEAN